MCVACFLLGCKKATEEKTGKREKLPFFLSTQKPSRFVLQISSFFQNESSFPKKKRNLKNWNGQWKDHPREPVCCCFGGREIWFFPQKTTSNFGHSLSLCGNFHSWTLRSWGTKPCLNTTHSLTQKKKCDELLWGQPFSPWEENEKKTLISWWNLSIFPVTKKILERKRHPKSPNSMLFLSIQIFPPNGEHLHHKSDTVETMIWRGSKPVSWCRQAKQTHQGKLFEENCFNLTTWKKKPSSITELSDVLLFDPRLFDFCKFVQNCLKKHASTPKLCDFCLPSQKICGIYSTFFLGSKKFEILCQHSPKFQKKILGRDETGCQVKKNFSCCTQWIHDCFFLQIVLISLWNCGTSDVFVIQFNFTSCRKHLFVVPSFTSHAVILAFNKFLHLLCSFQLFSFLILSPITRTYFLFHSQRTHRSTGFGVSDTQNRCSALSELARDQIITNKPCLQHHWNANCDHDLWNHWFVQSWRERFRFECFVLSRETTKQTKNTSFLSFPLPPMADLKPCYPKQYLPTHLTRKEELSIGSASSQWSCSQLSFCVSTTSHFSAKREAVETKNGCLKPLFWWMAWKWRLMNAINILDLPYLWLAYFNAKDNFPLCLFLLRCA